ncbi:MAG: carboxymuconolactone decarboxylase family protein [Rhodospirillaceae bacterium]|nr:carboxymuconolactone decarboxylase family protein [Rhodospirillaceae bacterium]
MNPSFVVHSVETAPEASQPMLRKVEQTMGMVPNMLRVLASSPAALEGYLTLSNVFGAKSGFGAVETHVILQTINRANTCEYCLAAHAVIAVNKQRVPVEIDQLLRRGAQLPDSRLEALRVFTAAVVNKKGWLDHAQLDAFLFAGFGPADVLNVILAVAMKTISNYANHVAETPLDDAFRTEFLKLNISPTKAAE